MSLIQLYYLKKAFDTLRYGREELEEHQKRLLNDAIDSLDEVPYYRGRKEFDREQISSLDDFREFPVLRRSDIESSEQFWNEGLSVAEQDETTGTTGSPLRIAFNRQASDWGAAILTRSLLLLGYRPTRMIAKYWDVDIDQSLLGRVCMPHRIVYKDDSFRYQLRMLERYDAPYMMYYPQVLFTLAKYKEAVDETFDIDPEIIFTHGELLTPNMREFIEETFDATVRDLYMTSELGVVAWECPDGGYHLAEDSVYAEVLGEDEEPVGPGVAGELVATNLTNRASIFLRHATGDVVVLSDEKCGCDTEFRRLERIRGRKKDVVETEDGRTIFPDEIIDLLAGVPELLTFQFVNGEEGYTVRYVPAAGIDETRLEAVRERFEEELGLSPSFREVDEIGVGYSSKLPVMRGADRGR